MTDTAIKCVMIIDPELPMGLVANTSAILGVTLGRQIPQMVGEDVMDGSEQVHLGITKVPVTMLRADKEAIKDLRVRLYRDEFGDLEVVDFSDVAQGCNVYEDYAAKSAATCGEQYNYYGVAIYGDKKKINKLTGFLPLLR